MSTRTRTKNQERVPGTVVWDWDHSSHELIGLGGIWAQCIDSVPGGGGALTISKFRSNGGFASGQSGLYHYNNYPLEAIRLPHWDFAIATRESMGMPSNSALAAKLLAMTNPSRPVVDLPVFIAELKDLPDLVAREGGKLIRKIAKYNLKYQFGIRPLISDLTNMLNFVEETEKRRKELAQLAKTGLRRKRNLASGGRASKGTSNLNSQYGLTVLNVPYSGCYASRVWGSVNWFPSSNFPSVSADLLPLARRAVLGLTIDGATAWELIPFSWLIDWYGSIGSYLMASRNIVPCFHDTPYIMEHSVSEWSYEIKQIPGVSISPVHTYSERKSRALVAPSPLTASLPLLSTRQMSILSSLLARRSRY